MNILYCVSEVSNSTGPINPCLNSSASGGPPGPPCTSSGERYIGVFVVAQILNGLGYCTMFTLGTVYLYENSDPNTGALYVGMNTTIRHVVNSNPNCSRPLLKSKSEYFTKSILCVCKTCRVFFGFECWLNWLIYSYL